MPWLGSLGSKEGIHPSPTVAEHRGLTWGWKCGALTRGVRKVLLKQACREKPASYGLTAAVQSLKEGKARHRSEDGQTHSLFLLFVSAKCFGGSVSAERFGDLFLRSFFGN